MADYCPLLSIPNEYRDALSCLYSVEHFPVSAAAGIFSYLALTSKLTDKFCFIFYSYDLCHRAILPISCF